MVCAELWEMPTAAGLKIGGGDVSMATCPSAEDVANAIPIASRVVDSLRPTRPGRRTALVLSINEAISVLLSGPSLVIEVLGERNGHGDLDQLSRNHVDGGRKIGSGHDDDRRWYGSAGVTGCW